MIEKRRNLFWEVTASDVSNVSDLFQRSHKICLTILQSLALGRPPAIHFSFVDCEFPNDEEATLNNDGQIEYGCKVLLFFVQHNPYRSISLAHETRLCPRSVYAYNRDYFDGKTKQLCCSFEPGPQGSRGCHSTEFDKSSWCQPVELCKSESSLCYPTPNSS